MKINIKGCLLAGIVIAASSCSSDYKEVELKDAGTLSEQLNGEQWANVKKLAIKGPLNNHDIAFIKALDNNGLEMLDLSKASNMKHLAFFFDNNKFSTIILPDSVEEIDQETFQGCTNLKEVRLDAKNKNFKIKDSILFNSDETKIVLYPAKLQNKSYTIPASVSMMSNCTFAECENLEEIKVAPGNKALISKDGVLYSADKSILLAYPSNKKDTLYTLPKEVKQINWSALWNIRNLKRINVEAGSNFKSIDGVLISKEGELVCFPAGKNLDNYTIPASVKAIGSCAFRGSKVASINISDSLFAIDKWALKGSNIQDIKSSGKNLIANNGILYSGGSIIVCAPNRGGKTTINRSLAITERALQNCSFEELTVEPVMIIGPFACSYSSKLKKVTLQEGNTNIKGQGMFFDCTSLEEAELPKTIEDLGNWTFFGCIKLKKLVVKAEKCPIIGDNTFEGVDPKSCVLYVPEKSLDCYKNDKNWSKFKEIVPIK